MSGRIIPEPFADDELIQRLMQFYGVFTIPELVRAQAKQIERLQAALPPERMGAFVDGGSFIRGGGR